MERTKLKFGESANDGTGFYLREGAQHIEDALSDLYMFLSGGQSQVKLPLALPRSRGGIGGVGEKGAREFVGSQGLKMFQPMLMKHVPVAYCTVGYGEPPKTTKVVELTKEITFFRSGVGVYKCDVFDGIKINADSIYIHPDNFGNRNVGGVVSYAGNQITITVYSLVYDPATGKFAPDTNKRVDIPSDTFMSFVLVNTAGTLL